MTVPAIDITIIDQGQNRASRATLYNARAREAFSWYVPDLNRKVSSCTNMADPAKADHTVHATIRAETGAARIVGLLQK